MFTSKSLVFVSGMVMGLAAGYLAGCVSLKAPAVVVREPAAPGESAIQYSPPKNPDLSLEFIGKVAPLISTMMGEQTVKVTDDIYAAIGYGFGTVTMVKTSEGLVIVDSGVSVDAARAVLAEFRKVTDQPVRYLIYTHSHQDHTLGGSVFAGEGVEVIATRRFIEFEDYQNRLLFGHHNRARAIQFGFIEPDYAFPLPISSGLTLFTNREWPKVVKPTITFEQEYEFTLGGKTFRLFATPGETPDALSIWLAQDKVLISGDNHYYSFPNLSTPLLEPRPVREWISSLDKYIALEPEILIPGHSEVLKGKDLIRERLVNYREAVAFVHDETVRCINEGKSVDEAVSSVRLPERLAELPYLQEYYGNVAWSVRGIYRGYTGWYSGDGTGLHPLAEGYLSRELVNMIGADRILTRAIELQKANEHQLCAELCDVVINANPDDRLAHRVKAESMYQLAFASENLNSFLCYRSAYSVHMKGAGAKPGEDMEFAPAE